MAVSGDVLGTAFVEIRAITDKFGADAAAKVKAGLGQVEKQADASGKKAGDALHQGIKGGAEKAHSSLLGMLGTSGAFAPVTSVLGEFSEKMDALSEHAGGASKAMVGIGAAMTGVGGLLQAAASSDQEAMGQLQASVDAVGGSWDDYEGRVEKAAAGEERYGKTTAETATALNTLVQATHDPEAALNRLQLVTDLAAQRHVSLNAAAGLVAKALGGSTRLFKQYGITVGTAADGTKDVNGALDQLGKQLSGQASAAAGTFTGHLSAIKAHLEDVAAEVGAKVGPVLTTLGPILLGVGAIAESGLIGKLRKIPAGVSSAFAKVGTFISSPIGLGVTAAVASLAVLGTELEMHAQEVGRAKVAADQWAASIGHVVDPSTFSNLQSLNLAWLQQGQALKDAQTQLHTTGGALKFLQDNMRDGVDMTTLLTHADSDLTDAQKANADQQRAVVGLLDQLGGRYGKTRDQVIAFASAHSIDLSKSLDEVAAQFDAVDKSALTYSGATATVKDAEGKLTASTSDLQTQLSALNTIFDTLAGSPIAAREAVISYDKSLTTIAATSIATGHTQEELQGALDGAESAALAAAQAHYKLNEQQYNTAVASQMMSVELGKARDQIIAAAVAAGASPAMIAALNAELSGTAGAAADAARQAGLLRDAILRIPPYVSTRVEIIEQHTGHIPTAGSGYGFASGGPVIPGQWQRPSSADIIPSMLTPGEFVVRADGSNLADALTFFTGRGAGGDGASVGTGPMLRLLASIDTRLSTLAPQIGQILNSTSTRAAFQARNSIH